MPSSAVVSQTVLSVAVHEARKAQVNRYANFSRLALMIYDIVLNLGREKQLVWDTKFRTYSLLYYMSRYPLVPFQVFEVFYTPSMPHCNAIYQSTWAIALVPTRIAIVASFVLRVYAVTMARGLLLVALLCLAGAAVVVFDILQVADTSCTQSAYPIATLLTFISLVTFDVLATAVISWRIYKVIREAGGLQRLSRHSMAGLIMRSGAIYFNVMTGIQVGSIVLYAEPEGVYSQALNNYTLLISSILTSRFLLDLRSAALDRTPDISTSQDCFSTNMHSIKFAYRRSRSNNSVEKSRWRWLTVVEDFEDPEMCDSDYMGDKGSELRELEQVRVSTENSDVRTGRDEEETSR